MLTVNQYQFTILTETRYDIWVEFVVNIIRNGGSSNKNSQQENLDFLLTNP